MDIEQNHQSLFVFSTVTKHPAWLEHPNSQQTFQNLGFSLPCCSSGAIIFLILPIVCRFHPGGELWIKFRWSMILGTMCPILTMAYEYGHTRSASEVVKSYYIDNHCPVVSPIYVCIYIYSNHITRYWLIDRIHQLYDWNILTYINYHGEWIN